MGNKSQPRSGSLQFWPKKKARKFFHSVNWEALKNKKPNVLILGFIAYKVGMSSCIVKDNTPDSMTKNKKIVIPVTILESPPMKIFSVRFYKGGRIKTEILGENLEKELKKKLKIPKEKVKKKLEDIEDYDDIRILVYSLVKQTSIKKTPDLAEIGLAGSLDEKINFIKENLGKEIQINEVFKDLGLVDVRGLTKGKGFSGPVKRFGIGLKNHKSEKGRRRPGSIGPWHPSYVTFRVPMAGQLGLFTRIQYNVKILEVGRIQEKNINPKSGFQGYGNIKTNYIIVGGSIGGAKKRQVLLTFPLRKTKKKEKINYEIVKLK